MVWFWFRLHGLYSNQLVNSVQRPLKCLNLQVTFLLASYHLFCQLPILCIPLIDRWHSTMLFWLKPSRLIRPPIYSLKQARLRKRMVRKYCTLYFAVLILFVIVIVRPAVASGAIDDIEPSGLQDGPFKGLFPNQDTRTTTIQAKEAAAMHQLLHTLTTVIHQSSQTDCLLNIALKLK